MCIRRVDKIRVSIILKMINFDSFKASGSTFPHLHKRLLKSFKEAVSLYDIWANQYLCFVVHYFMSILVLQSS